MTQRRDERGVSLVELVVSLAVGLLVLVLGFTIINSSDNAATTIAATATNANDARAVLTRLDADLRYAADVWLCTPSSGGTWGSGSCTSASGASSPAAPACSTSGGPDLCAAPALVAESLQDACTYWSLTGGDLVETSGSGTVWEEPGVTGLALPAPAAGSGFGLPLAGLVEIDLSVDDAAVRNAGGDESRALMASPADAASVHQLIAPDDLTVAAASTRKPCSP